LSGCGSFECQKKQHVINAFVKFERVEIFENVTQQDTRDLTTATSKRVLELSVK